MDTEALQLHAWRHPKPQGAQGRCIGQTDLPVDRRKAKRLAHRIRQAARRHQWPRVIHTSPLKRCALVGQQLKRWGWQHHVHEALREMDFGAWDGLPWSAISQLEVDAWCADFLHGKPGQGESLHQFFERLAQWASVHATGPQQLPCLIVAHAGCMQAWQWLGRGQALPAQAAQWPKPAAYGECLALPEAQYLPVTPASRR